ncbi:MAG: prepilin-type N-terminal cleavage/methylation domain-containing protein [Phycisphaera sp.]|nr:MAG: prepilin-type N-terminal cleavage/methylation domain-containing protein [Phycisphaera sp.]
MNRRAMTLLEVVMATALLAIAASGIATAMAGITRSNSDLGVTQPPSGVARVADRVLSNPAVFRFDPIKIAADGSGTIAIDETGEPIRLEITFLQRSGHGAWLAFSFDGQTTARWIRLPEAQP